MEISNWGRPCAKDAVGTDQNYFFGCSACYRLAAMIDARAPELDNTVQNAASRFGVSSKCTTEEDTERA